MADPRPIGCRLMSQHDVKLTKIAGLSQAGRPAKLDNMAAS